MIYLAKFILSILYYITFTLSIFIYLAWRIIRLRIYDEELKTRSSSLSPKKITDKLKFTNNYVR